MMHNRISSRRGNKSTSTTKSKWIFFNGKCILGAAALFLFAPFWLTVISFYHIGDENHSSASGSVVEVGMRGAAIENIRPNEQRQQQQKQQLQLQQQKEAESLSSSAPIIAYATSLTGCPSDPYSHFADGAAVLAHSIHLNSIRNPASNSRYDYQLYAIVHPTARSCSHLLHQLGYKVIDGEDLVPVKDIQGDFLREHVEKNGCCGEKEYIKLHSYRLLDHPVVVHLDMDVLILQPLDDLFDIMILDEKEGSEARKKIPVMFEQPIPLKVNAFYTRDYNTVPPKKKRKGVQGGFFVLRPSMDTYNDFVNIIREGHFTSRGGWGNLGYKFYGGMTFQGIVPYYHESVKPGTAVELNRCVYNQMADNPRTEKTVNDIVSGDCLTDEDECEDCRNRPLEEIKTVHFTVCYKPWTCTPHFQDQLQHRLCRKLYREWFRVRRDLEVNVWKRDEGKENFEKDVFFGYCKGHRDDDYIPMNLYPPYPVIDTE